MKKRFFLAASVLLLTACTAPDADIAPSNAPAATKTPETAVFTPTPAPTEEPTLPLYWIGECNSQGFYQREPIYDATTYAYGGGGIMAHYFDFANATEEIVGEPLDLKTANLHLYADEESLYWFWSGMITDTPILLRSDLDGSNRQPLYDFPQGTSLAVWNGGLAGDGTALYFAYCHISDDPAVLDDYELVRLDPITVWPIPRN